MTGPNKPILDIQINAGEFEAFQKKYAEYKASLGDMPAAWQAAGAATKESTEATSELNAFLERHLAAMDEVDKKQADEREGAEKLAAAWEVVTHYARQFHSNVQSSTQFLSKWIGLTAVFSSVLGAGGLFGISRLDQMATDRRAYAASQGNSYGEQQSFDTAFGRLGGAANLDWTNSLLSDPRQSWKLGNDAQKLQGEDAASAFADLLPRLKATVDKFPKAQFDEAAQVYGIPQDLARILASMSPDEIRQMIAAYHSNANSLNLDPGILRKWNDLNQTVDLAGGKIDTAFRNKLVLLTPGLEKFITAVGDIIGYALRDGGQIDKWLKDAGRGLNYVANEMSSKSFDNMVDGFVTNLNTVTKLIEQIVTTNLLDTLEDKWWHEGLGGKLAVAGVEAVRTAGHVAATTIDDAVKVARTEAKAAKEREKQTGVPGYISNPAVITGAIVRNAVNTWRAAGAAKDFLGNVFGSTPNRAGEPYGPSNPITGAGSSAPYKPQSNDLSRYLSPNTNPLTSFTKGTSEDSDIKGMHPNAQQRARESMKPQVTIDVPYGNTVAAH